MTVLPASLALDLTAALPPALHCCDCHTVRPTGAMPAALAVHAQSRHLHLKLAARLREAGVPFEVVAGGLVVSGGGIEQLPGVLEAFSETERPELLAAPWIEGRPEAWQVAPLERWARRLTSGWFEAATRQLQFQMQPIVSLGGGEVYGYEALVRALWQGERIGAWPLLEAAAAHGQARAFDAHARRTAIAQVYPQLRADEVLFINFAPGVVYDPAICLQTTFQACRAVGADFSRLLFEVTESESFPNLALLKTILERYRAEGAQVALDDLGAGHTSLTYLAELRPDLVKLDRALIRGLQADDPRTPLIQALVTYAHDLGIRVVAEGIETTTELQLVRELGADYGQGYFLGRPADRPEGLQAQAAGTWARP